MNEKNWHFGPPPHVGWWLTSATCVGESERWRWWDGRRWSFGIAESAGLTTVRWCSKTITCFPQSSIAWCHYYPENARVPRVDPNAQEARPLRTNEKLEKPGVSIVFGALASPVSHQLRQQGLVPQQGNAILWDSAAQSLALLHTAKFLTDIEVANARKRILRDIAKRVTRQA